jgi:glutamine amidotransferase
MSGSKISIIDHGTGNLFSVASALEKLGAQPEFISKPEDVLKSERIILPGVGAFADGMRALEKLGLVEVLREAANNRPLLGICLGMQMLFEESEEMGATNGLGLIDGKVCRIPNKTKDNKSIKIPHIGWNSLELSNNEVDWQGTVLQGIKPKESVYFVHSYVPVLSNNENCIAETIYGDNKLSIAVKNGHVSGCQFHPERSGPTGLKILSNFINE